MKTLITFTLLALCTCCKAQTIQYVTLVCEKTNNYKASLTVATNQIITLADHDWSFMPAVLATSPDGSVINLTSTNTSTPVIATGMQTISVQPSFPGPGICSWATFKIETPNAPTVVSNYVPADCVVIPSSATGNVQIILESSPDLINWTAASPGSYGPSSATNRFFRVRAVTN